LRKFFAILLMICLVTPFYSGALFLQWQKKQVKKEVKRQIIKGMDKEYLVLLKFSYPETTTLLRWEHSREFEYRGEMYDVVETIAEEDSVAYWCWHDQRETRLNRRLKAMIEDAAEENPQTRETYRWLANYFQLQFLPSYSGEVLFADDGMEIRYPYRFIRIYDYAFPPPVPPPWLL